MSEPVVVCAIAMFEGYTVTVVTELANDGPGRAEWAFLLYRLPREPSAPRLALWRTLRRLGALILSDGLVALPADARTVEHLEWIAAGLADNGGSGSVWVARPATRREGDRLAEQSRAAADLEYRQVMQEAALVDARELGPARRTARRLRRQLRAISARDFFGAPSAARARAAVERLARDDAAVDVRA